MRELHSIDDAPTADEKMKYVESKMKGTGAPARYFNLGDDRTKWDAEIAAGHAEWRKEFVASGGEMTDAEFASQHLPKAPGGATPMGEVLAAHEAGRRL